MLTDFDHINLVILNRSSEYSYFKSQNDFLFIFVVWSVSSIRRSFSCEGERGGALGRHQRSHSGSLPEGEFLVKKIGFGREFGGSLI